MKIIYVLNKVSHTSIPLEMASLISEEEEVTIVSLYDSNTSGYKISKEVAPNCRFIPCDGQNNLLAGLCKLRSILIKGSYDVVHTHQTLSGAWARYITRNIKNTKKIHTVHAHHNSFNNRQNLLIGFTLKYADCIVANSQTTLKGLKNWQKKLIHNVPTKVIYNGVNVNEIINVDQKKSNEILRKYRIQENEYIFGLVGRLVKVKNHANVLKAFEKFLIEAKDTKKYKLMLVGDGPERENIRNIIESSDLLRDNVVCTGLIDRKTVYSLLYRMNTFIMASFHEGFCNALMEARVVGLKTIISKIDIFTELYENEEMIAFNPNSIDEITKSMIKAVNSTSTTNDTNNVIEKYDISTSVEQYLELYHIV